MGVSWEQDKQALADFFARLQEQFPLAPYTGYVVLSLFTLLFFILWRRAAFKGEIARKTAASLTYALGNPTQQNADTLRTVQQIQSEALLTVRNIQSDAMIKLAAANTQALEAVKDVVQSFTENEEE